MKSLQIYPTIYLEGDNALARLYSIIVGIPGLPTQLKAEIDRAIEESDEEMM